MKNDPFLSNSITLDVYSLSDPSTRISRCEYAENSGTFDPSRQLYLQFGHFSELASRYSVESISFEKRYTNASSLSYFSIWEGGNWEIERLYTNCSDECYELSPEEGSLFINASLENEDDIFALGITFPMDEGAYFDVGKNGSRLSIGLSA